MQEMPSLNMPVKRLKVAILPQDLTCSGPLTNSGAILTTGKSHGKKPDRISLNDDTDVNIFTLKHLTTLLNVSILRSSSGNRHCSLLKLYVRKLITLLYVSMIGQHIRK